MGVLGAAIIVLAVILVVELQLLFDFTWSSFLPDLLVSCATGVTVGLFLLFAERRSAQRDVSNSAINDWRALEPRIDAYADQVLERNTNDLRIVGGGLSSIVALTQDRPVSLWVEIVGSPKIRELYTLLSTFYRHEVSASNLETLLSSACNRRVGKGRNKEVAAAVVRGRLLGFSNRDIRHHTLATAEWLRAHNDELVSIADDVEPWAGEWKAARNELDVSYVRLFALVRDSDPVR